MVDALEEMAAQAEAQDDDGLFDDEDDEDDDDYEDAEDDEEDDDFDVDDMQQVITADLDGMEDDEDDDDEEGEEDDDDDDDDGDDDDDEGGGGATQMSLADLIQAALSPRNEGEAGNEGDENAQNRTTRAIRGIGIAGLRQLLAQGGFRLRSDEDDEDDEDDADANWYGTARSCGLENFWEPVKEPLEAGKELLHGGEFGRIPKRPLEATPSSFDEGRNLVERVNKRRTALNRIPKSQMDDLLPNSSGTEVARYPARVYCGQYSEGECLSLRKSDYECD